ncbi:MAG: GNAT family N-acetyltransferase [Candidatus Caldatribacterium sp.]|uniref:GNAT family N-acetyltransferase n=1 Tax=Candidatus Caldatribacterium sp. TaxID=2282143 RepID=UPI002999D7D4|nr:GNAT family N-acetyltransferase [Candidatus Caldatribacterium sp.]MDW8081601.1 GNAT family N-acetyltransferase [Candidatus Calescibacterium sp.]
MNGPMGDLRIVNPTEEELRCLMPDLVHLYERAYAALPEYGYHLSQRIEGYIRWLFRGDPKGFFVALLGERVAGFIGVHAQWWEDGELFGEIHEFVVDPDFQGKGIGTALFTHALTYLETSGRRKIGLWVGEKNEHAIAFYLRRGFRRVGQYGKWVRMVKEVSVPVPSRDSGETPPSSGSKR